MKFENLLKSAKIGTLELKNRVIMPAMATNLAGEWGEVSDELINWYVRRAKGGVGLIICEVCCAATAIDPLGIVSRTLRADDICYIAGLACLAEAIHENGAKAGIQLSPGGGAKVRGGPRIPGSQAIEKIQSVSPSGVPAVGYKDQPRVLTIEEIKKLVELMGIAAQNVKQAGFDLIEIHAHAAYLIHQFLSPYFNKRADEYGGSLENRCRFLLEIVDSVRKSVGPVFPLIVKYDIDDFLPSAWDVEQAQFLAKKLEAAGVNGIGASSGGFPPKMPLIPPYFYPPGVFLPLAEAVKKVVSIPVYASGRLGAPELAEKALKDGKIDFAALGRPLIADPDWVRKVERGQIEEIRPCIACNECPEVLGLGHPVRCTVNAAAGRESKYELIKPAEVKKKVLVVGGGPAGMEAARIAALRGYDVILCERYRQLGGLMLASGVHNEEITKLVNWMVTQIKKLLIELRLETEVTPARVEQIKPDVVILATGGTFVAPKVPGINRDNVFSAQDLLNLMHGIPIKKGILVRAISTLGARVITASSVSRVLESDFYIKKRLAIIGGQFPGCSLALFLAKKGKKVTVIEESDHYGDGIEAFTLIALNSEVEAGNVKILTSVKIDEITEDGVVFIDKEGVRRLEEVDTVILALELAPSESKLAEDLKDKVKEVYIIGDAKSFRRIRTAIYEGYTTAYNL